MKKEKICVLGLGYIGLPTATMFAVSGFEVIGVDVKPKVVETINKGNIHIEEPGLEDLVKNTVKKGDLRANTEPEAADVFIIAVPTPLTQSKGIKLNYVRSAIQMINPYLKKGNLVIIESTITPRTTEDIILPELRNSGLDPRKDIYVSHCPERVLPGKIINELINNNRVVGGINEESALKSRSLYRNFVEGEIYITDATTAEMVKLMENTYRDVNIALANELAKVSEKVKIDIWEAIELANKHPRVNIHKPGPGVGGHCLAIDPWFIVEKAPEIAKLIHLSRNINDSMPKFVVKNVKEKLFGINNPKIAILGITYKGNVDDLRESPVLKIIDSFIEQGVELGIYDPHVNECQYKLNTLDEAIKGADCIIIGTDHKEFKNIDPIKMYKLMRNKILFDTKNLLEQDKWKNAGFSVYKIGNYSEYNWHNSYGINEEFDIKKEMI